MFAVIYRWRIKPEFESQFVESWSEITEYLMKNFGALGSRLHRGDELWYAYAQWKSSEERDFAFHNLPEIAVRERMKQAIEESFPEIKLEIIADFLILPQKI
jgi:Antibiotic biosynthesis monooxygenase